MSNLIGLKEKRKRKLELAWRTIETNCITKGGIL